MDINKILPLVEKSIQGNKKAYANLCEAIIRDVIYVCIKITGDVQLGEEAAQEALIRMGKYIKNLRNPHAFPLWLNRHLANSCRNYLRAEKRHQGHELDGLFEEIMEDHTEFLPAQWAEREDARQMVLSCLQKLPPRQQHILLMYYFQDMSTKDIAAVNKISESAVRSNLQYARGNLKKQIEKTAGTQLSSLPAASAVPTITVILQKDAARLVTEESAKKVLLAVSTALAGSAATVAGVQIATLVAGIAPAAAALVMAAAIPLVSSPSPSLSPIDGIGTTPQYSDSASIQDEGEGDLYIAESSIVISPGSIPRYEPVEPPHSAQLPASIGHEVSGQVFMTGVQGDVLLHPRLNLGGICVQAYQGATLAATAYTDGQGNYTLALPDGQRAYSLQIANNAIPRIGPQGAGAVLEAGASSAPPLYITDTLAPLCSVSFGDAEGTPGAITNPLTIQMRVSDATPCTVAWEIIPAGQTVPALAGASATIKLEDYTLETGWYTLHITVTDLCGNVATQEKYFRIQ